MEGEDLLSHLLDAGKLGRPDDASDLFDTDVLDLTDTLTSDRVAIPDRLEGLFFAIYTDAAGDDHLLFVGQISEDLREALADFVVCDDHILEPRKSKMTTTVYRVFLKKVKIKICNCSLNISA